MEGLKNIGRHAMRQVYASPIRGRTRMRGVMDALLAPAHGIESVKIGDYRVLLDHRELATRNMAYRVYEVNELAWLRRFLRPGDLVLDVGSNVGYMAAHFAGMVGRAGAVFAFEPSARAFALLSRMADSGASSVIRPVRAAVSNRCGSAVFFETDQILANGYGRIDRRPSARFCCDEQVVPVTTLDEFAGRHALGKVRFVKLDIEGAEGAAIEGMVGLLSKASPVVLTEITTTGDLHRDLLSYGEVLTSFGLRPYRVSRRLLPVDYREIPAGSHFNLLWLPREVDPRGGDSRA